MITPTEIASKLERLYPKAGRAVLNNEVDFFPHRLRVDLVPSSDIARAIREVDALRNASKSSIGHGYSIQWQSRRSRSLGQNDFPDAIVVESMEDLVRAVGKQRSWQRLLNAVEILRSRHPSLHPWVIQNWQRLEGIEDRVGPLLDVVDYLLAHPRPNCFVRELPLAISTKWVSEHQSLLAQWLDLLLPPSSINVTASPRDFENRYGFRSATEHLRVRLLDDALQQRFGFPCSEFSLPVSVLQQTRMEEVRVIFAENKVNWLTLPCMTNTIALGGLGRGIAQLFSVDWMKQVPCVYWGDLDAEGFEILGMVRRQWPQIRSILMDAATLHAFQQLAIPGTGRMVSAPDTLLDPESAAMHQCLRSNIRLEQEHIPQSAVMEALREIGWLHDA
ncbi:MAG: DUF3322 domain-containing protein [Planctomycetota bacterium]|jgi:hypothetical protein